MKASLTSTVDWVKVGRMQRTRMLWSLKAWVLAAVAAAITAACAGQARLLDDKQGSAMQTALDQGRADLSCQQLSPNIISREVGLPSQQGSWVEGIYRAVYTINVQGCGKNATYSVICPDGDIRCFVSGSGSPSTGSSPQPY